MMGPRWLREQMQREGRRLMTEEEMIIDALRDEVRKLRAAPLLPGVSASECRELAVDIGGVIALITREEWPETAKALDRAAAILRELATAIDKGGKP